MWASSSQQSQGSSDDAFLESPNSRNNFWQGPQGNNFQRKNQLESSPNPNFDIPSLKQSIRSSIRTFSKSPSVNEKASQLVSLDPTNIEYLHLEAQATAITRKEDSIPLFRELSRKSQLQYLNIQCDLATTLMKTGKD